MFIKKKLKGINQTIRILQANDYFKNIFYILIKILFRVKHSKQITQSNPKICELNGSLISIS